MENQIICNTIPIYSEAPVSLELLKTYIPKVMEIISKSQLNKKYLIVNKENKEVLDLIEKQIKILANLDIELLETQVKDGFVYGNSTAIENLVKGEKPMPSGRNMGSQIYSVEELLDLDHKTVFIEIDDKNKSLYTFNKTIKPRELLNKCEIDNFKGMYFGHPMGTFISEAQLDDEILLKTDYINIFNEKECIVDKLVKIIKKYLIESCGKCVFGHEGTTQIHMILSDIANKRGRAGDIELLIELCTQMKAQSLCEIGVSAADTVITAIDNFREEIENHITKKDCKALVCNKFVTYHIIVDKCVGCNECQDVCDEEAILGKKKLIHIIDQDECIQCGACINVCEEGAIIKAGKIKPKTLNKPIPCKA